MGSVLLCLLFYTFIFKRPACFTTLQDISHHCSPLQIPALFSMEHLQKMPNIKQKKNHL